MKILFAGTPAFAIPSLSAVLKAGYEVAAVLTQPDRPRGRKAIPAPSPLKQYAISLGLSVLQPEKLTDSLAELKAVGADLMVTCAYGQILTQEILDLFPLGVWNIHASLLPAYRGAAPIARAIINGEKETGVTVMKTELGLDTGDMLLAGSIAVSASDTAGSLSEKLSFLGAELVAPALAMIESGNYALTKQGEGFVCKKVERTAADFSKPAGEVSALIRGLSPAPLAYGTVEGLLLNFYFAEAVPDDSSAPCGTVLGASPKEGLIVKCGEGAVKITELQPAGGKRMSARDFLNGRKLEKGMRFDQPVL